MYSIFNIVGGLEEQFNESGTLKFFNVVLVSGNNIMGKTPREEERLGMNRGRAFKNKSPRVDII